MDPEKREDSRMPRWPAHFDGLWSGVVFLLAISLLMLLLYWLRPSGNHNPWLVVKGSSGTLPNVSSITAMFTTHFFHGNWNHLVGNLLGLWVAGMLAFSIAGANRTLNAVFYAMVFSGIAMALYSPGNTYSFGSSSLIFGFLGLIILASIRKGNLTILIPLLLIGYLDGAFFDTIRPTATTEALNISWLAHLGGLIGGFYADLKDPGEAIRVLYKESLIDSKTARSLLVKVYPELYPDLVEPKTDLREVSKVDLEREKIT